MNPHTIATAIAQEHAMFMLPGLNASPPVAAYSANGYSAIDLDAMNDPRLWRTIMDVHAAISGDVDEVEAERDAAASAAYDDGSSDGFDEGHRAGIDDAADAAESWAREAGLSEEAVASLIKAVEAA